jgi:hypothetical protein
MTIKYEDAERLVNRMVSKGLLASTAVSVQAQIGEIMKWDQVAYDALDGTLDTMSSNEPDFTEPEMTDQDAKHIDDLCANIKEDLAADNRKVAVDFELNALKTTAKTLSNNLRRFWSNNTLTDIFGKVQVALLNRANAFLKGVNCSFQKLTNRLTEYPYSRDLEKAVNSVQDYGRQAPAVVGMKHTMGKPLREEMETLIVDAGKERHGNPKNLPTLMGFVNDVGGYGDALNHPPPKTIIDNLWQKNMEERRLNKAAKQSPKKSTKKPAKKSKKITKTTKRG